jgi:hypothetical protein
MPHEPFRPSSSCAVVGCPFPGITVARIGLVLRPTGACSYQLGPIDVRLCSEHANIVSPADEIYMYSIEWEGR